MTLIMTSTSTQSHSKEWGVAQVVLNNGSLLRKDFGKIGSSDVLLCIENLISIILN